MPETEQKERAAAMYGKALNEGRELFPKGANAQFSEWVANANLEFDVHPADQAAGLWVSSHQLGGNGMTDQATMYGAAYRRQGPQGSVAGTLWGNPNDGGLAHVWVSTQRRP